MAEFIWRTSHGVTGNFKRLLHWSQRVARDTHGREHVELSDVYEAARLFPAISIGEAGGVEEGPVAARLPGSAAARGILRFVARSACFTSRYDAHRPVRISWLEPGLARHDLGGGQEVSGRAEAGAAIDRLAWAVQCEVSVAQATLIPASGACLLPLRGRHYGCPQCWLEFYLAGKPLVILREWALRQSWLCRKHEALLVDLRNVPRRADGVIDLASLRRLAAMAVRALELLGSAEPRLLANRHAALKLLGQGAAERPPPGLDAYMREFSANRLHVVPARTLLLAHAHITTGACRAVLPGRSRCLRAPGRAANYAAPWTAMTMAMLAVTLRRVHRHRYAKVSSA
jgi:hypothetical protein